MKGTGSLSFERPRREQGARLFLFERIERSELRRLPAARFDGLLTFEQYEELLKSLRVMPTWLALAAVLATPPSHEGPAPGAASPTPRADDRTCADLRADDRASPRADAPTREHPHRPRAPPLARSSPRRARSRPPGQVRWDLNLRTNPPRSA